MARLGRDTVTIWETPLTDDGGGGKVEGEPVMIFSGLAEVEPVKPSRRLEAAQVTMTAAIRVKLWRHGLPDVETGHVINWRNVSYSFTGPFLPVDASEREFVATATQITGV
nr:hypothetical protein [uncultured Arsenicibacter sp.]